VDGAHLKSKNDLASIERAIRESGQSVLSAQEDPQMMIRLPNIFEILILLRFIPAAF
jgi:hypothetical protein